MTKLTLNHVSAITHAERALLGTISRSMEPRYRQEIETDLLRLASVKRAVLRYLYEPGLQFPTEIPQETKPHGDTRPSDTQR